MLSRRQLLGSLALLPALPAQAGKPNVIVILADDLGYGDLASYGNHLTPTPGTDRLAREGRRFTHAYTSSSVCSPTRYGLITGRYCWRTSLQSGVLNVTAPLHIEPSRLTLGSLFKKHGYQTAAVGKWHLGYGSADPVDWTNPLTPGPRELGFDYHFAVPSNHGDQTHAFVENDRLLGRKPDLPFVLNGKKLPEALAQPRVDDRVNLTLTEKALGFLEKQSAAQPFFLYFTPVAVHNPITPNKRFRGKSKAGIYGDYICELDYAVEQVLGVLDRKGLAGNTLVLFSSDNGAVVAKGAPAAEFPLTLEDDTNDSISAHYRQGKSEAEQAGLKSVGDLRGRKHSVYEGGFRVPYLVRWPGQVPANTVSDEVVQLTDTLASCAALLGAKLPAGAGEDSYDVRPAWFGKKLAQPIREATVVHSAEGVFAIRQGPWKMIEARDFKDSRKKRNPWHAEAFNQLYNLAADPGETKNLWDQHPDVVTRLQGLLSRYRRDGRSRPA